MSAGIAGYQTLTTSIKRFRKLLWQNRGNEGPPKAASRKLTARRHLGPRRSALGPRCIFKLRSSARSVPRKSRACHGGAAIPALEPRSKNQVEHDGREDDQPEITVRPEPSQAIVRVVDVERGHLPEEMGTGSAHAKEEHDSGA